MTIAAIKGIKAKALVAVDQRVGFRLVTKFGEKRAFYRGMVVQIVGGLVGAGLETLAINVVGGVAKKVFIGS